MKEPIPEEIEVLIGLGHSLHERAESLIAALDGIEADAKKLRKAAHQVKKLTPPRKP